MLATIMDVTVQKKEMPVTNTAPLFLSFQNFAASQF